MRLPALVLLVLAADLAAHGGGVYRGPENVVPPDPASWRGSWRALEGPVTPPVRLSAADLDRVVLQLRSLVGGAEPALARAAVDGLARVGDGRDHPGVVATLRACLRSPDAEVRRRALVGLGRSDSGALPLLVELARGSLWGRGALDPEGHRAVADDLRAAACTGLGRLAGAARGSHALQARIQTALAEVLSGADDPALAGAAIGGLGRVLPGADAALLRGTLRALTRHYDARLPRRLEATRWLVPAAVAELLGRGDTGWHRYFKVRFAQDLASTAPSRPAGARRRAAALALGRLAGREGADAEYSAQLRGLVRAQPDGILQAFCRLALGRIAGCENRAFLVAGLSGRSSRGAAWSALALGVAGRDDRTARLEVEPVLALQVRTATDGSVRDACATALRLCRQPAPDAGARLRAACAVAADATASLKRRIEALAEVGGGPER